MLGILADNNAKQEVECLLYRLRRDWSDIWSDLAWRVRTFEDLGLVDEAGDVEIWRTCQANELALLTNNRNHDGPTSLEEAIRTLNDPTCLPVFTFANALRFRADEPYAALVVEHFLEYALDIERYRGVGRLFLPRSVE